MKKHILIIDDEEGIRYVLSEILTVQGYRVSSARTGNEALRMIKADPPNAIISDLQMEDTDGLELVEKLREALPNVPVILLTGVIFEPDVVQKTIQKKVAAYIDKTASLDIILSEVQRVLGEVPTEASSPAA